MYNATSAKGNQKHITRKVQSQIYDLWRLMFKGFL